MDKKFKAHIDTAIKELDNPTFNLTKQYLEVMKVEKENGVPKVARIDDKQSDSNIIYFYIKNEKFFLVVNVSKKKPFEVEWVWIESGHRVYLTATSKKLTYKELSSNLSLSPLSGWSKGEIKQQNQLEYKFSRVSYEPNKNEAYGLEEKLVELLITLEKDTEGVRSLSKIADSYISICKNQYISANKGIHLNMDIISRLNNLNLEIDIDTYICGNELK